MFLYDILKLIEADAAIVPGIPRFILQLWLNIASKPSTIALTLLPNPATDVLHVEHSDVQHVEHSDVLHVDHHVYISKTCVIILALRCIVVSEEFKRYEPLLSHSLVWDTVQIIHCQGEYSIQLLHMEHK